MQRQDGHGWLDTAFTEVTAFPLTLNNSLLPFFASICLVSVRASYNHEPEKVVIHTGYCYPILTLHDGNLNEFKQACQNQKRKLLGKLTN